MIYHTEQLYELIQTNQLNADSSDKIIANSETIEELKEFLSFYEVDRKLSLRDVYNGTIESGLTETLKNRILYYDKFRGHELVSFQAIEMTCVCWTIYLSLCIQNSKLQREKQL